MNRSELWLKSFAIIGAELVSLEMNREVRETCPETGMYRTFEPVGPGVIMVTIKLWTGRLVDLQFEQEE